MQKLCLFAALSTYVFVCAHAYLIGLCIIRTLCILGLFDVLYHLSKEGMTVVLILGHQHFQHEPQAPRQISTRSINMLHVAAFVINTF